jgi:hypothetical protein
MVASDGSLVIVILSPGEIYGQMSYLLSDVGGTYVKVTTGAEALFLSGNDVSKLHERISRL